MAVEAVEESDDIAGVVIVTPKVFADGRGYFVETWRREWVPGSAEMVQANRADRQKGCIVGLHYHRHQADYWYVPFGRARVILHDLRVGSPTEAATMALDLGGDGGPTHDHRGVYIPPGVAHGFAALTDLTITYLVEQTYNPEDELGVAWDDPEIAADWGLTAVGVGEPMLSARDTSNPKRSALAEDMRPRWKG